MRQRAVIAAGATHSLARRHGGFPFAWNALAALLDALGIPLTNAEGLPRLPWRRAQVLSWGNGGSGQTGGGDALPRPTPQPIATTIANEVISIAAGSYHSLALDRKGRVWTWGRNDRGQLGDGTQNGRLEPGLIDGLENLPVISVAGGGWHSLAIGRDQALHAWGHNEYGQLGDTSLNWRPRPVDTLFRMFDGSDVPGGDRVTVCSAGLQHSLAINRDVVWAWGLNDFGQVCTPSVTPALFEHKPVPYVDLGAVSVAAGGQHSLALSFDREVWGWGNNDLGQIGGVVERRGGLRRLRIHGDVVAIAAGLNHSLAIDSDGRVWACGDNSQGQLGDGTTTRRLDPVRLEGLPRMRAIAGGETFSLAVDTDERVWSWGDNRLFQLGDGTNVVRPTPALIGLEGVGFASYSGLE